MLLHCREVGYRFIEIAAPSNVDNPPGVVPASGTAITRRSWDYPNPVLIAALALTAVLWAALAVLRR